MEFQGNWRILGPRLLLWVVDEILVRRSDDGREDDDGRDEDARGPVGQALRVALHMASHCARNSLRLSLDTSIINSKDEITIEKVSMKYYLT